MSLFNRNVPVSQGANPIRTFQDEMNRLFSDFFGESSVPAWWRSGSAPALSPAVDVTENGKEFKITAELPGLDTKDVQVTAADGYLTIRGEKKEESKEEKEGYFRQERSYGSFQRVVALPESANFEKADAKFDKGVLTIAIPKKAGTQSAERRIEIKKAA